MQVVYAKTTSRVQTPEGVPIMVRHGSHWPAEDPVVKAYPSLFSDDPRYGLSATDNSVFEESGASEVEQATAAPGERRQVRRAQA